jgi:hypothetical protein
MNKEITLALAGYLSSFDLKGGKRYQYRIDFMICKDGSNAG